MKDIIKLSVSGLEQDERVRADDNCMMKITSEGLDVVCKRQRNNHEN
jgi:hypothetical protein